MTNQWKTTLHVSSSTTGIVNALVSGQNGTSFLSETIPSALHMHFGSSACSMADTAQHATATILLATAKCGAVICSERSPERRVRGMITFLRRSPIIAAIGQLRRHCAIAGYPLFFWLRLAGGDDTAASTRQPPQAPAIAAKIDIDRRPSQRLFVLSNTTSPTSQLSRSSTSTDPYHGPRTILSFFACPRLHREMKSRAGDTIGHCRRRCRHSLERWRQAAIVADLFHS